MTATVTVLSSVGEVCRSAGDGEAACAHVDLAQWPGGWCSSQCSSSCRLASDDNFFFDIDIDFVAVGVEAMSDPEGHLSVSDRQWK